jgi:dual specificity tyrosine-phosphorylation-regulated kinase 2/3/4
MLSSFESIPKSQNLTQEKLSPKSKKVVVRSSSRGNQSRIKPRRSFLKITLDAPNRNNFSMAYGKLPSTQNTPKSTSFKMNSPSMNMRKSSSRFFRNSSNRTLNFSASPKSNQLGIEKIEFPLKPARALNLLKHELNNYEQGEILKYSEIYFVGTISNKLIPKGDKDNFGYDDNHTDYLLVKNDHIAYRYEILSLLGKGSFGQVCECFDHKKKEKVALKVIKNKPKFHQQATVEVKVLHRLRECDPENKKNIIRMKNYFSFRNHVCITFELVSLNLYDFLRLNNFSGISENLIKNFAKQILNALEFTTSLGVVHCDVKPENVLLVNPKKADVKLIDFGSSCFVNERLHTYIQSRFYRAPEIMLGIAYTCAIDMWSLGCIIVELVNGQPLWPGECEKDQLLYIISFLGLPPAEVLKTATRKHLFFEGGNLKFDKFSNGSQAIVAGFNLEAGVKTNCADLIDFVKKCFDWDPEKRMKPTEGLMHPWILHGGKVRSDSIKKVIKKAG